jgi:hypothetical protein
MNINLGPRNSNDKITSYINNSIHLILPLDYEVNQFLNEGDLFEILMEDLPLHDECRENKNIFVQDICEITTDFYKKTTSKNIRLQLKIITNDKCRFFHVDHNIQRLLCTYHGPGTEWLDEDNINRKELGQGDNNKIAKNLTEVRTANKFDILILRGRNYSNNTSGAVHRSPSLKPANQRRILLVIDEI